MNISCVMRAISCPVEFLMRYVLPLLILAFGCKPGELITNNYYGDSGESEDTDVNGDPTDDTEVLEDTEKPQETDEPIDQVPEYTGERAVLEGWLESDEPVTVDPGDDSVLFGDWAFQLTSFDGTARTVVIDPNEIHFSVDSNRDGLFGTTDDLEVLAEEIIRYCWLNVAPSLEIGGPELNVMTGEYPELRIANTAQERSVTAHLSLECSIRSDALTGVAIAANLSGFDITSDSDVYDASWAVRLANSGNSLRYWVQIGSRDACDSYDLMRRYGAVGQVESLPLFNWDTTETFYRSNERLASGSGMFNTADGCGDGYMVTDIAFKIDNLPEDVVFTETVVAFTFDAFAWVWVDCVPGPDGFGHNEILCEVFGLEGDEFMVTPDKQGVDFAFNLMDIPELPMGWDAHLTMSYHWVDLATGGGTDTFAGWPEMDGDTMSVTPY